MSEKPEYEVDCLAKELDALKNGLSTSAGCVKIAETVVAQEATDPLVKHGENPYLQAPSSNGGCACIIC